MELILIFIFMVLSLPLFAQSIPCQDKLLLYNRTSGAHLLTKNEWNDGGKDALDSDSALSAFRTLIINKLMCLESEITVKIAPACQTFLVDIPQSTTCYLFTSLGYFFISKDMGRNVNFVFSKDKRFPEH
jgi:hypothetical protein